MFCNVFNTNLKKRIYKTTTTTTITTNTPTTTKGKAHHKYPEGE